MKYYAWIYTHLENSIMFWNLEVKGQAYISIKRIYQKVMDGFPRNGAYMCILSSKISFCKSKLKVKLQQTYTRVRLTHC